MVYSVYHIHLKAVSKSSGCANVITLVTKALLIQEPSPSRDNPLEVIISVVNRSELGVSGQGFVSLVGAFFVLKLLN